MADTLTLEDFVACGPGSEATDTQGTGRLQHWTKEHWPKDNSLRWWTKGRNWCLDEHMAFAAAENGTVITKKVPHAG